MIYLDNAATTQVHPKVVEAMMPYLTDEYGNPGGIYSLGRKAAEAVKKARQQVAGLIKCHPENIIFTSGGSEANNLVIKGVSKCMSDGFTRRVLTDKSEHTSVIQAIAHSPLYVEDYIPINESGQVSADEFERLFEPCVGIASVMMVNNIVGSCNDVSTLAKIARKHGVLFHTDCVQAIGYYDVDVNQIGCDFLSMSGHKIHASKGVGALYVRDSDYITPLISGGSDQEFGLRGGTENVAGIVGFGKACEIANNYRSQTRDAILSLKNEFAAALHDELVSRDLLKYTHINAYHRDSRIMNVRFDDVDAQTLVIMADTMGVCISAGSACQSKINAPNPTLIAIGLTPEQARQSIRISFSEFNTVEEMSKAARIIAECVQKLRGMSNE